MDFSLLTLLSNSETSSTEVTSTPYALSSTDNTFAVVIASAGPTVKIQVSNDSALAAANWVTVATVTSTQTRELTSPYYAMQATVTSTSGISTAVYHCTNGPAVIPLA